MGVDNGEVLANPRQELRYTQAQGPLGILAHKDRDRRILVHDFQHTVEELGTVDGLRPNPVHLFPVAHGVGIGGAIQAAGAHEVVELVLQMLAGKVLRKGIGNLLNLHQILGQIGVHLGIIGVIVGEVALTAQEAVRHHKELQLFIALVADAVIHQSGQLSIRLVNEPQHLCAVALGQTNRIHDLRGGAAHRGENHKGSRAHTLIACGAILCGIGGEGIHVGVLLEIAYHLHTAGPCAADAQPAEVFHALCQQTVDQLFDLRPQCQSTVYAVDLFLFIKLNQGYPSIFAAMD